MLIDVFTHRTERIVRSWMSLLLFAVLSSCSEASGPESLEKAARFTVGNTVLNADVHAFSATNAGFGNTYLDGGGAFEPSWLRMSLVATADDADAVHADRAALTHWDTFREHLLEGAEVEVYRVQGGVLKSVRSDRVARGGARFAGWTSLVGGDRLVPRGVSQFAFRWDAWNRPSAGYFFSVRAVDDRGVESAPSDAIRVVSPEPIPGGAVTLSEQTQKFRALIPPRDAAIPAAPKDLQGAIDAQGTLHLSWSAPPAENVMGYRVYVSDDPPDRHGPGVLQLEGKAMNSEQAIRKGDWVMLRKKLYTVSREQDFAQRTWNAPQQSYFQFLPGLIDFLPDEKSGIHWELAPHAADSPVPDHGETYLKLTLAAGQEAFLGTYNYAGTDGTWYDVLQTRPYNYSVWLRKEGSGSVRFQVSGLYDATGQRIAPQDVPVSNNWGQSTGRFTPPVVLKRDIPGRMGLVFRGPATFYVDNLRLTQSDTPYLEMLPEDRAALHDAGMHMLRTHALVRTGLHGYDLAQLTNPGGIIASTGRRNTLPQILGELDRGGLDPWLQIEMYLSAQDWRDLVEYLAAPYDPATDTPKTKPWAYKRFSQGRDAPWTDAFGQINFELSNETWNNLFAPWVFPDMTDGQTHQKVTSGAVYGLYQESVIRALRSSPWWGSQKLERKFKFVLGGFAAVPQWGLDAARVSPSSDLLTIAAYNGGWDRGQGPREDALKSYFEVLNDVSVDAIPVADELASSVAQLNQGRSKPIKLGTYEAGPGYAMNGLNGEHVTKEQDAGQERVMKSLAAGTATLDGFLARAYRGFVEQNYFTFGRGSKWSSHARWFEGGQAWPAWQLLALFNHEGVGSMLEVKVETVPSWAFADEKHKGKTVERPLVGAYALVRGQRFMLFLTSRKIAHFPVADSSGITPVDVQLPFSHYKSASVFRTSGAPTDNNLDGEHVRVLRLALGSDALHAGVLTVGVQTGSDVAGLAPAATMLYVFEGVETSLPR